MKLNQKVRKAIQLLSIILVSVGIYTNFPVTMFIIMGVMVIGGTIYCGWLCPFGALQEWTYELGNRLKIKRRIVPKSINRFLKYMRFIVFILFMVLTGDIIFTLLSYNPEKLFSSMLSGYVSLIGFMVIFLFLIVGLFYERFFCSYLCTEGAKYSLVSCLRLFTVHRDTEKCVGCKKCDKVCSRNIDISESGDVSSIDCISCLKCMDACPIEKTLKIKRSRKMGLKAVTIVVVFIVIMALNITKNQGDDFLITEAAAIKSIVDIDLLKTDEDKEYEPLTMNSTEDVGVVIRGGGSVSNSTQVMATEEDVDASEIEEKTNVTTSEANVEADVALEVIVDGYKDGVYTGEGEGFKGTITVEVKIESNVIQEIKVVEHRDDRKWYNRAVRIIDDMLDAQSTEVNLVSGATYSSRGIREAVKVALLKAK